MIDVESVDSALRAMRAGVHDPFHYFPRPVFLLHEGYDVVDGVGDEVSILFLPDIFSGLHRSGSLIRSIVSIDSFNLLFIFLCF